MQLQVVCDRLGVKGFSHSTSLSAGVGLLFSKSFTPKPIMVQLIIQGRCLLVRASFDHFIIVFINVYTPKTSAERKYLLKIPKKKLIECESSNHFSLGSDFNCTENKFLDLSRSFRASSQFFSVLWISWSPPMAWGMNGEGCKIVFFFKYHFSIFKTCRILPMGFTDHLLLLGSDFIKKNLTQKCHLWGGASKQVMV